MVLVAVRYATNTFIKQMSGTLMNTTNMLIT